MNPPRYVLEDPSLPHQIVLAFSGHEIAVSCTCLQGAEGGRHTRRMPLAMCMKWEPGEAYACWLEHTAAAGEVVA